MSKRWWIRRGCVLLAALVPFSGIAQSSAQSTEDVTVITSEKLTFDYNQQYALFENDVVVVDPRMKIYADKMTVTFNKQNKAESVKAEGNVIIIQEDKRARAAAAEYLVASGEVTLTGNPMITSGKNIFTAETIKFWRDDNRMEGKPKSRLVIYPEGDAMRDKLFMEPVRGR